MKATKTESLKVTVIFAGDDAYKASGATATIKIIKETSKFAAKKKAFKVKKSKKYTITIKSKSEKVINKVKVTLNVKGKKMPQTLKIVKLNSTFKKLTKRVNIKQQLHLLETNSSTRQQLM